MEHMPTKNAAIVRVCDYGNLLDHLFLKKIDTVI